MKVLYVGPLDPNGTCFTRWKALRTIQGDVDVFDSSFVGQSNNRLYSYLENQVGYGRTFSRANQELFELVRSLKPQVVWVDKGFWIWPKTLAALKSPDVYWVHHNTDDLFSDRGRFHYRFMRQTLKDFDLHFTTNQDNVREFLDYGVKEVELTSLGYDHERFFPRKLTPEEGQAWAHPIVFVGHWEPASENYVLALARAKLPLMVYGYNWRKASRRKELALVMRPQFLGGEDYVNCLRGAKIGLGFVSKINRNQSAGRSFEIPGCGTFLLAQRTEEHLRCYQEGVEAVFFNGEEELVKKASWYLVHDQEREAIAKNGYNRCAMSGYSWLDHMKRDWQKVLARVGKA